MEQIGTIEILQSRIYALDAVMSHEPNATTVVVEPGEYPIHSDGLSTFWMMTGCINIGRISRLGDGMFTMTPADQISDRTVTFPSRTYGPDEWAEFLASDVCQDGHPDQRLRVRLSVSPSR